MAGFVCGGQCPRKLQHTVSALVDRTTTSFQVQGLVGIAYLSYHGFFSPFTRDLDMIVVAPQESMYR